MLSKDVNARFKLSEIGANVPCATKRFKYKICCGFDKNVSFCVCLLCVHVKWDIIYDDIKKMGE